MEITLEHTLEAFSEADWNSLAMKSATNTVFQTYPWHRAWVESLGKDQELWILAVRAQGALLGIAPLIVTKKRALRILKFIGQGHADYCDFLYPSDRSDVFQAIMGFLKSNQDKWDAMALDYIPQSSPTVHNLSELGRDKGLFVNVYARQTCPFIRIDADGNQLQDLMAKKNLQRDYKHLQKQGNYSAVHYKRREDIDLLMHVFFEQHIRRRERLAAPSLFVRTENKTFYRSLVKHMSPMGWLLMTSVMINEKPVAFHFGWDYNGTLLYYKPSYDPAWAKHSPGDGLLMESFRYALNNGLREFDFAAGDESYKSRYANDRREIVSFKVFKSAGFSQISLLIDTIKGWVGK